MLLKNIIIPALFFAISATATFAFQPVIDVPEEPVYSYHLTVNENSMACFQTLQCLISENPFKNSNLDKIRLNNSKSQRFLVEGSSENEELHAVYQGNGTLIEATVIQRNIILPKKIYETLAAGEFESWTMIENKLEIKNFVENTKQYTVVLSRDNEVRVEYFDKTGNLI